MRTGGVGPASVGPEHALFTRAPRILCPEADPRASVGNSAEPGRSFQARPSWKLTSSPVNESEPCSLTPEVTAAFEAVSGPAALRLSLLPGSPALPRSGGHIRTRTAGCAIITTRPLPPAGGASKGRPKDTERRSNFPLRGQNPGLQGRGWAERRARLGGTECPTGMPGRRKPLPPPWRASSTFLPAPCPWCRNQVFKARVFGGFVGHRMVSCLHASSVAEP